MDTNSLEGESAARTSRSGDIQAVDRVSQVLALLGPHRERIDSATVAELTGLNRTTAHRYLVSMSHAGLLRRSGSEFEVGPVVAQLGALYLGKQDVVKVAPPHMRSLVDRTRLTCALSIRVDDAAVVIHVENDTSFDGLLLTVPVGARLDAFSAHGQVLAAFTRTPLDGATLPYELQKYLETLLEETRDTGVGLRAVEEDVYVAIAAPIYAHGVVCGAISLLGTPATLPRSRDSDAARELLACARAISESLEGVQA